MPAPKKLYFDPAKPPKPVSYNGHPVIPLPALQGLLRALLSHWKISANEKDKFEQFLLPTVYSFSDSKLIQLCEEDASPNYQVSVARMATYVERSIKNIRRPCHPALLQAHAQVVDDLLKPFFLKTKRYRNPNHRAKTLREHLDQCQELLLRSVACSQSHPQASSLPNDKIFHSWSLISQPARLRNAIIAYYHGLKSAQYVGQLLAGRTT